MKRSKTLKTLTTVAMACGALALTSCKEESVKTVEAQVFADSLFAVMNADRSNYTKLIVQRLGPNNGAFIAPDEYWEDKDDGAPLPAQMFRYGAEHVAEVTDKFSYSLQSIWPINPQNEPKTGLEKEGLEYIAANPGKNFYGEEELGGVTYYTAVYPDVAVSPACTNCHNQHKDTPRDDFALGEVMGGVVIRIPLDG